MTCAAQVPVGWKLVPVEPASEMTQACMHNDNGGLVTPEYRCAIYRAMLAAAPEAPAGAAQVPSEDAKDAARYRHLVAMCNVDHDPSEPWQLVIWEPATGEDWEAKLNAAIDTSIAALSQQGDAK